MSSGAPPAGELALAPCARAAGGRDSGEAVPGEHVDLGVIVRGPRNISLSLAPLAVRGKASGNFGIF
eukprot:3014106-Pyramimonas_sp.AAC.1